MSLVWLLNALFPCQQVRLSIGHLAHLLHAVCNKCGFQKKIKKSAPPTPLPRTLTGTRDVFWLYLNSQTTGSSLVTFVRLRLAPGRTRLLDMLALGPALLVTVHHEVADGLYSSVAISLTKIPSHASAAVRTWTPSSSSVTCHSSWPETSHVIYSNESLQFYPSFAVRLPSVREMTYDARSGKLFPHRS